MKTHHLIPILTLTLLIGCKPKDEPIDTPTPYILEIPRFFPTLTNIPTDNPLTEEGIALGHKLFYDSRLSGRNDTQGITCCASCHHQEHNFEIGDKPLGTHHVMLPMVNLAWNRTGLGWNGGIATLEEMVHAAVIAKDEINGDTTQIVKFLQETDDYPILFKKAFGSDRITFVNIERAIAQFLRSMVSADSKFDRYLRGEEQLSQDELNGYLLFVTEEGADCFHCHGGGGNALMTTHLFYNNGLDRVATDPQDRFAITGDPQDHGAYKAPTLRNIALSGPYMHDGRFSTLDEVIDFYSDSIQNNPQISSLMHHVAQGGIRLTDEEKRQLKAFLNTLTDSTFINNPNYAAPQ
ncbi:MAG: c-type cytochrome [Bacteroidales bacterium]|nr:c-type cytochrome [Bacteroidales bacterium]